MLTLPDEGLIVPNNAISKTRPYVSDSAKANPVAIINPDADRRSLRWSTLAPSIPMHNVASAEPRSARVATTPISNAPRPIAAR